MGKTGCPPSAAALPPSPVQAPICVTVSGAASCPLPEPFPVKSNCWLGGMLAADATWEVKVSGPPGSWLEG